MFKVRSLVLFLATVIGIVKVYAQPDIDWQITLGGSAEEIAYDVEQCPDGGYIVVGSARSDDGDISDNFNWRDFWVVKLTAGGELDWEASYGGSNHETAQDVLPTMDGGYIVVGQTSSEDGQVSGHQGSGDYWILKLDSIGHIDWERTYGGSSSEFGYAIEQTSDGGYYMAGGSQSMNGDVSENKGGVDYWIIRIAATGELIWERSYGGSQDDLAFALDKTADGGCVVTGRTRSSDGDVTGFHGGVNFSFDAWVIKLSDQGELEWEHALGGTDFDDCYTIRQTGDGGYILAGLTRSTDGDVTGNPLGTDLWVIKLDESGEISWQNFYGGFQSDIAGDIQQTSDGGYIVTGCTGQVGSKRFWTLKLTPEGILDWQKSYGGFDDDRSFSIKQTNDDGFIVAGRTASNNDDVSGNNGDYDYWVVKLGPCGVNTDVEIQEEGLQSEEVALSSTYQWIDCGTGLPVEGAQEAFFAPPAGGEYAVILTNGSCVDTSDCINYCPLPQNLSLLGDTTLQVDAEVAQLDIQWFNCNTDSIISGATGPSFTPTENGYYGAIMTNENCSQTTECQYVCPQGVPVELTVQNDTLFAITDTELATQYRWFDCSNGHFITQGSRPFFVPEQSGEYGLIVNQRGCASELVCFTYCGIDTQVSNSSGTLQAAADPDVSTFQWIDCTDGSPIPEATTATYTPVLSGSYAVIISQGACVDTSQCSLVCLLDTELVVEEGLIQAPENNSYSYQWIDCNTGSDIPGATESSFAPTVSGRYAVVITEGECEVTSSCVLLCAIDTSVTVEGNTIISQADTLASTFQWFDCSDESLLQGETSYTLTPTEDGIYAVIIRQGACSESTECVEFMIVGTEEIPAAFLEVYPNPVQDILYVRHLDHDYLYNITTQEGALLKSGRLSVTDSKLSVQDLPAGVYYLSLQDPKTWLVRRFVKF